MSRARKASMARPAVMEGAFEGVLDGAGMAGAAMTLSGRACSRTGRTWSSGGPSCCYYWVIRSVVVPCVLVPLLVEALPLVGQRERGVADLAQPVPQLDRVGRQKLQVLGLRVLV